MCHMEKFQITDPPKVWVPGLPNKSPMCSFTLPDILIFQVHCRVWIIVNDSHTP